MSVVPRRRAFAWCVAFFFVLGTAGVSQAQTAGSFIPQPSTASTRGGTIIATQNISTFYLSNVTATVDGVSTPIVHATFDSYWLVAPPHAAGAATVIVVATNGGTTDYFSATITYVERPQVGLASPVTIVSRATDGSQSTGRSERFGSSMASSSADGRFVLFRSDSGFAGLPGNTRQDLYRKDLSDEPGELLRAFACGLECQSASISADGTRVMARHTYYNGSTRSCLTT